jgi:hypothetical protein
MLDGVALISGTIQSYVIYGIRRIVHYPARGYRTDLAAIGNWTRALMPHSVSFP